nr:unnamed protein product [Papilio xuthus]
MHTTQIKPKTFIKPKPNVLTDTNISAFKNIDDSIPKTDNSQIENESNDYEKFNENVNGFKDNNDVLETNLSKESNSLLVFEQTEKLIMKDVEIELARNSTLDASDNYIESTPQENVSKESNLPLVSGLAEKSIMKGVEIELARNSTLDASDNLITSTLQGNVSKESNSLLESEITEKSIMKDSEIELARDSTLEESDNFIESTPQENVLKESNLPLVSGLTEKSMMKDGNIESVRDSTLDASDKFIESTPQENVSKESNLPLVSGLTEKSMMKDGDIESIRDSTLDESINTITSTLQGNVSKESNSLLESEITEKIILKDGETELARDDTLEESYNLIEFTSQENVTETEYLKNENINVGELENDDILDELNKSEENEQSKDLNNRNDSKKSGIPVFIQRKTLSNEKESTCHQFSKTEIIYDFLISDKTLLVDDPKDIHPTTLDINNGNKKFNEIKEQDIRTKIQLTHDESSINPCISDDNKNTKDMNDLKDISLSEHDINSMKVATDFDNHYPEPFNIIELKNVAILNSEPSESCNTEINNEKPIDDETLDSNKETQPGLFATDLSVITTQIKELDENIAITSRELTECRDEKKEFLFEIEQVKGLLANEKMKDESENLNLAEIRKLEDKLDDLVENQSNIDKTIVSFERIQKAHEDARNRLEADLKRYNQKRGEKFNISEQKDQGLHSIDLPQNESVQSVKNMSIDQNLTETQFTHNKCDLPYVPSQANPFLCDSSRQASKDINLYRDKNSHINSSRQASRDGSFDQNRSISDSFLEEKCSEPKNTNEKPEADLKQSSSIEHHPNNQVNDMETNTDNEVNSKPHNNNVIEIVNPPITPSSNYQPIPLPRKSKLNSITKPTYSDNDENNFIPASNSTILCDTGSSVCEIDKISNVNEDPINTIKSDKHKKPTDNAQYDNLNDKKEDKTINLTRNQKKKASRKKNKSSNHNTVILKEENEINSDDEKSVDMSKDEHVTVNKHDNKSDKFLDSDKNNATPLQKNPTEQIIVDESKNDCPHINKPLESSILKDDDKDINDIPTKEPSSCNDMA